MAEGDDGHDHNWNESIYVRNSSLIMKSGYVENMIFTRDNSSYTNGDVTEEGYPPCNVTIYAGSFKGYEPKAEHIAEGSNLITVADQNMSYVIDVTFKTQPTPQDGRAFWNEKKTISWESGIDADSYSIEAYDDAKKDWTNVATIKEAKGSETSFDLADSVSSAVKKTYRVVAYKGVVPVAVSSSFFISWERPEDVIVDPPHEGGKEDPGKIPGELDPGMNNDKDGSKAAPAEKGTRLDVKKQDGGEYTVISGPGETPQVAYSLGAAAGSKKITIGGRVTAGGVTYEVTAIADNGLKNNKKVKTIVLKDTVTSIGQNAFSGCKSLTTITIPASVKRFGAKMFAKCPKLKLIIFKSKKLKASCFHKKTFKGLRTACVIKVPKTKVKGYQKLFRMKGLAKKVKVRK